MCVLIVRPPGKFVSRAHLKESFRMNSDGAGFMFDDPETNEVRVFKGWFGFRQFYKDVRCCERTYTDSTFVIHMRIGTSGLKDMANCHPFSINANAGFAHNGVMHSLGDKTRSDTREFVEDILCKLPDKFWENQAIVDKIQACAKAASSKFVMLLGTGEYIIFNEALGHWYEGCWYSNYSYTLPIKTTSTPTKTTRAPLYTPPLVVSDAEHCSLCYTALNDATIGFKRHTLKLCRDCLTHLYDNVQIQCTTCLMKNTLTADLLFGRKDQCEFCHSAIDIDDVVWQLLSTFADD